jgi:hypothetical protein
MSDPPLCSHVERGFKHSDRHVADPTTSSAGSRYSQPTGPAAFCGRARSALPAFTSIDSAALQSTISAGSRTKPGLGNWEVLFHNSRGRGMATIAGVPREGRLGRSSRQIRPLPQARSQSGVA